MVRRKATNALVTGLMTGAVDGFLLQPLFARFGFGLSDDMLRVALGLFASKLPGGKMVRNIAMAEGIIGASNIGRGLASGAGLFGSNNNGGDF